MGSPGVRPPIIVLLGNIIRRAQSHFHVEFHIAERLFSDQLINWKGRLDPPADAEWLALDPIHSFCLPGWTSRGLTTRPSQALKTFVLQAFLPVGVTEAPPHRIRSLAQPTRRPRDPLPLPQPRTTNHAHAHLPLRTADGNDLTRTAHPQRHRGQGSDPRALETEFGLKYTGDCPRDNHSATARAFGPGSRITSPPRTRCMFSPIAQQPQFGSHVNLRSIASAIRSAKSPVRDGSGAFVGCLRGSLLRSRHTLTCTITLALSPIATWQPGALPASLSTPPPIDAVMRSAVVCTIGRCHRQPPSPWCCDS